MIRIFLGFGLILIAIIALVIMVQSIEANPLNAQITSIVCQPGEKLTEVLGAYQQRTASSSGGRSVTYYCEGDGRQTDVTGPMVGVIAGSFVIPFLLGLVMIITGFIGGVRRMTKPLTSSVMLGNISAPGTVVQTNMMGGKPKVITTTWSGTASDLDNLPPEQAEAVRQALSTVDSMFSGMGSMSQFATSPFSDSDFAGRLEQLKEALDKGLITQSEYDRVRQQILDSMK